MSSSVPRPPFYTPQLSIPGDDHFFSSVLGVIFLCSLFRLEARPQVLSFEFWVFSFVWVLSFELWVLSFVWVLSSEFWVFGVFFLPPLNWGFFSFLLFFFSSFFFFFSTFLSFFFPSLFLIMKRKVSWLVIDLAIVAAPGLSMADANILVLVESGNGGRVKGRLAPAVWTLDSGSGTGPRLNSCERKRKQPLQESTSSVSSERQVKRIASPAPNHPQSKILRQYVLDLSGLRLYS